MGISAMRTPNVLSDRRRQGRGISDLMVTLVCPSCGQPMRRIEQPPDNWTARVLTHECAACRVMFCEAESSDGPERAIDPVLQHEEEEGALLN